jgi:site-specific recombinase XerD
MPPKSGHERVVPRALELVEAIGPFLRHKLPNTRVVLNAHGSTPGRTHVLTALKALLKRENLPERSFHALPHYFCSFLVRRGASLVAVRLLAGHGNLQTTQRYVHAAGGDLKAAIAKFSGN